MSNLNPSGNSASSSQLQINKDLHKFIQEQSKKMIKKIENFIQIQTELMEFRIFLSLHADRKEMQNIVTSIRKNRDTLWTKLLKENNGNKKKAMDYFYQ